MLTIHFYITKLNCYALSRDKTQQKVMLKESWEGSQRLLMTEWNTNFKSLLFKNNCSIQMTIDLTFSYKWKLNLTILGHNKSSSLWYVTNLIWPDRALDVMCPEKKCASVLILLLCRKCSYHQTNTTQPWCLKENVLH